MTASAIIPQPSASMDRVALRIAIASEKNSKFFGSVQVIGRDMAFQTARYAYVGAPLFIGLWCTGPEPDQCGPFADLTKAYVRGMAVELADNEILVKAYNENDFLRDPLLASGYFEDTQRRQDAGFADLEVWRVTDKFVSEFAAANAPSWAKAASA